MPPHVAKPQRSLWIYLIDKIGQNGALRKLDCNWQLMLDLSILPVEAAPPTEPPIGPEGDKQIGQKCRRAV